MPAIFLLVHGQVTIIFVVSVCMSVCSSRVFLSRLWSGTQKNYLVILWLSWFLVIL